MSDLIQYNWCPYMERKFGHRHVCEKGNVQTQREDRRLQARRRGPRQVLPSQPSERTSPAGTLISDFWPPEYETMNCYCLNHPVLGLCCGRPSKLTRCHTIDAPVTPGCSPPLQLTGCEVVTYLNCLFFCSAINSICTALLM